MTTTLEREEHDITECFGNVDKLEELARSLPEDQARTLHEVAESLLDQVQPVRPRIAAHLLALSEKTVRAWTAEGVLQQTEGTSSRLVLDPKRLHAVVHLVRDFRAGGTDRDLLDAVWWRLQDQALLDNDDLRDSLAQMRRGETTEA